MMANAFNYKIGNGLMSGACIVFIIIIIIIFVILGLIYQGASVYDYFIGVFYITK
jgi:hypothetical protein